MERAIQVMDYAIVIISAADGVEGHTETVWQLLEKHQVPTFFFLNKIDREGTNVADVIKEIRENLTEDIFDFTTSFTNGVMEEDLIEFIAERDEELIRTLYGKRIRQGSLAGKGKRNDSSIVNSSHVQQGQPCMIMVWMSSSIC